MLSGGFFFSRLTAPVSRLRAAFGKSRILGAITCAYPRIDGAWKRAMGRRCEGFSHAHFFLRQSEESFFGRAARRIGREVWRTSVGSLAKALLFYLLFRGVLWFFLPTKEQSVLLLAGWIAMAALSAVLLGVKVSIGEAIGKGRIIGCFLFDFCQCMRHETGEKARRRLWMPLVLGFFFAIASHFVSEWIFFLAVAVIPGVILLFYVPELAVCLLFLAFPFFNLFPRPTLLLLVFGGLILLAWLNKAICCRRASGFDVLDFSVLAIGLLYGAYGSVGFGGLASFAEGFVRMWLVLLWFPVRYLLASHRWRGRAVTSLVLSATAISFWGILEYFFFAGELKYVDLGRFSSIGSRVTATYENPNFLAVYLVLCAPFCLYLFLGRGQGRFLRRLGGIGFLAVCGCTVLTWTRGAWLGLLFAFAVFLLLYSKTGLMLCLALPLVPIWLFPYLPSSLLIRFTSIGNLAESSIRYRLYTWEGVGRMLAAYPCGIGVGESAFLAIYPHFAVSGTERVMHSHRLDLQILCDLGFLGLFVVAVWLIFLLLRLLHRMAHSKGLDRLLALCCMCSLFGGIVMGAFDYVWYHFGNFALFIAVAACGTPIFTGEENEYVT